MNRNQSYDRFNRDRYQSQGSRQYEQFSDDDRDYGDDNRSYGQMGESGSRSSYGQSDNDGYGSRSGGWAGERNRGGYDRDRDDRQRGSSYSGQGSSSSSGGYGSSRYSGSEGRGFESFTSNDFGGRDFSGQSRNYGAGQNSSGSYGGYGETGYGSGSYAGSGGYGAGGYSRSSGSYGSTNRGSSERGFFERAGDEVASWFGDDDAARRREQDHRGRGPANYTRSDERVLEDACDRLTDDWGVNASNIQVTVQNGEVTLDGTVPSRQQKRRAEDCVENLSGVKHVQNNLRVQQGSDRTDASSTSSGSQTLGETSYDRTDSSSGTLT